MDSLSNKPSGSPGLSPIGSGPSMSSAAPAKDGGGGLRQMEPAPKPVSTPMSPATKRKIGFGIIAALAVAGIAAAVMMGGGQQPAPAPMPAPQVVQQVAPQMAPAQAMPPQIVGQVGAIRETSPPGGPMWGFYAELTTVNETVTTIGNNGSDLISSTAPIVGWRYLGFTASDCAAVMAGCQLGDVMISYRGERTAEDGGVISRIHASGTEKPLDVIEVVVIRDGRRITLTGPVGYVSSLAGLHP
jgi:hypothetical protein